MSVYVTPLTITPDGKKHIPAPDGSLVDPSYVPVSTGRDNIVSMKDDGLSVAPADAISVQSSNALKTGADNKLWVDAKVLVRDGEKVLSVADNVIGSTLSLRLDATANVLELLGANGQKVADVKLPVVPGLPIVAEILKDTTPPGLEKGTYLHLQFKLSDGELKDVWYSVANLVDVYTAGYGIAIYQNEISAVLDPAGSLKFTTEGMAIDIPSLVFPFDNVLGTADGSIHTHLTVEVDDEANVIRLRGRNNALVSETKLPSYSGAPSVVEVVQNFTPPGQAEGTYLHMRFPLAGGGEKDLYWNLDKLVDIYIAGDGIDVKGGVIALKPEAGKGLYALPNGAGVTTSELVHKDDKLLAVLDNGLYVNFSLRSVPEENKIQVIGNKDAVVAEVEVPASVGLPTLVEVLPDFIPPPPHGSGKEEERSTWLHIHWDLPDGTEHDVYTDIGVGMCEWAARVEGRIPSGELLDKLLEDLCPGAFIYATEGDPTEVFLTPDEGDARYVALAGDQTIEGVKTFTSAPVVPVPAQPGEAANAGYVAAQIEAERGNIGFGLERHGKVLRVKLSDLPDNTGALFVAAGGLNVNTAKLVSAEERNMLALGWDGLLYAKETTPDDLVSQADGNQLRVAKSDARLYVAASKSYVAGQGVVIDGQVIAVKVAPLGAVKFTADGELYVLPASLLSEEPNNALTLDDVGQLIVDFSKSVSKVPGNALFTDSQGNLAVRATDLLSPAPGNVISLDSAGKLYARAQDGVTTDMLGPGLKLENGKIALDIDPDSPLKLTPEGKLTIDESKLKMGVSADAGNNLKVGSDGRAYYPDNLGNV